MPPSAKGNQGTKRKSTLKKQKSRRAKSSSSSRSSSSSKRDSGSDNDSDKYRDLIKAMDKSRKSGDGSRLLGALPSFGGAGASPDLQSFLQDMAGNRPTATFGGARAGSRLSQAHQSSINRGAGSGG